MEIFKGVEYFQNPPWNKGELVQKATEMKLTDDEVILVVIGVMVITVKVAHRVIKTQVIMLTLTQSIHQGKYIIHNSPTN